MKSDLGTEVTLICSASGNHLITSPERRLWDSNSVKKWGLHRLAIGGCSGAGSKLPKEVRNKEVAKLPLCSRTRPLCYMNYSLLASLI